MNQKKLTQQPKNKMTKRPLDTQNYDEQPSKKLASDESITTTLYQMIHNQDAPIPETIETAAKWLTQEVVLCVAGNEYLRLAEIEFYFTTTANGGKHPDPFTHQHINQKNCGNWYFHRATQKDNSPYKSNTYKGLDIAIGDKTIFGGVLIRGLLKHDQTLSPFGGKSKSSWNLIDGPCKCVDYIFQKNGGFDGVESFVEQKLGGGLSVDKNENVLCLVHKSKLPTNVQVQLFPKNKYDKIYSGPRVGLTLKKRDHAKERRQYIMKPYRFCITPAETKKGKVNMVCSYFYQNNVQDQEDLSDECHRLFAIKKNSAHQYLKDYLSGLQNAQMTDHEFDKKFVGADISTSILCELAGCLGCG
jgi:hypothetical protein